MNTKVINLFLHYLFVPILIINCTAPIDYYGNNINLHEENIYLSELRDHKKDKFILVFKGHFNKISKSDMAKREVTLNRYKFFYDQYLREADITSKNVIPNLFCSTYKLST